MTRTLTAAAIMLATIATPAVAQKTATYSPAIERAYAARGVVNEVRKECSEHLIVNLPAVIEVQKEAGQNGKERPTMAAQRQFDKAFRDQVDFAAKRNNLYLRSLSGDDYCLALLYAFGPDGTWIKGLVEETP
jgi:hypothetical protein